MESDVKVQCADMVLTDAVRDLADRMQVPTAEIRSAIISSPAYDALYDFDTGLWQMGPDYFIDFFLRMNR